MPLLASPHVLCDNLNDINYFIKERNKLNTPIWVGETGEMGNTIYWGTSQYLAANKCKHTFLTLLILLI
jgi:hypothetical protein